MIPGTCKIIGHICDQCWARINVVVVHPVFQTLIVTLLSCIEYNISNPFCLANEPSMGLANDMDYGGIR